MMVAEMLATLHVLWYQFFAGYNSVTAEDFGKLVFLLLSLCLFLNFILIYKAYFAIFSITVVFLYRYG